MYTAIGILIFVGVSLCLAGAILALRAWLSLRRERASFQSSVVEEVSRLSARTAELERGVNDLVARASDLPFKIVELQRSITLLQTLTGALSVSLLQATKILTFPGLKVLSATQFEKTLDQLSDAVSKRVQR